MRYLISSLGLLALMLLAGCSGSDNAAVSGNTTTLKMLIGSTPVTDVAEVNVNITQIALMPADAEEEEGEFETLGAKPEGVGPYVVFTGDIVVNLLDYANTPLGDLFALAPATLPAGEYHAIHLYLGDNNTVKLNDGTVLPLAVPAGKIALDFFETFQANATETIVLDFDLASGLVFTGGQGWKLEPTIRIGSDSVTGDVMGALGLPADLTLAADLEVKITIPLLEDKAEAEIEFEEGATIDGDAIPFYLHAVPAGIYTAEFYVKYGGQSSWFTAPLTVTAGETADMGTIPITGITF